MVDVVIVSKFFCRFLSAGINTDDFIAVSVTLDRVGIKAANEAGAEHSKPDHTVGLSGCDEKWIVISKRVSSLQLPFYFLQKAPHFSGSNAKEKR